MERKVWAAKSPISGYIVLVLDEQDNVVFGRMFKQMWDAINWFRA